MAMNPDEKHYLAHYNSKDYPAPIYTVDTAIYTLHESELLVLLVERGNHPHKGKWALPGGFVNLEQDLDINETALRMLMAKTGVEAPLLEQVATIGNPTRDPRGWSVSTLYLALIPYTPVQQMLDSVTDVVWHPLNAVEKLDLAFDHLKLIEMATQRLQSKTAYTALPMHVLKKPFTLTQLQQAFELLLNKKLEKKSFRRRILNANLLTEVGESVQENGKGRPAALYEPSPKLDQYAFIRVFGG